jgi:hypothetical protein
VVLRERVADDPVGEGEDAAGDALEDASADQQRQAVAERADDRAGDEHGHDGGERPPAPVEVAELADQRRGDRGRDEVGGEEPRDGDRAGAELAHQRRHRGQDQRLRQRVRHPRREQDDQDRAAPLRHPASSSQIPLAEVNSV